ncbi:MAG: sensor histidine kinase [Betaproteobacteria bacterium]|nr:sensor histidine kinase [Betaproteobacteria bacterium]
MTQRVATHAECTPMADRHKCTRVRGPSITKSARRRAVAMRRLWERLPNIRRAPFAMPLHASAYASPLVTAGSTPSVNPSLDHEALALEQVRLERERIARDLHDDVGQALTGLKLDIAWLKRRLTPSGVGDLAIAQRIAEMALYIDSSLERVRELSGTLRRPYIDVKNLHVEIESSIRELVARGGLKLFADIGIMPSLDPALALHLLRLIQEALTNVVRHAHATSVWVYLARTGQQIELRIRDDGTGVTADTCKRRSGGGIQGMHERAQFLGGHLSISSASQRGTLVHLEFPVPQCKQPSH